MTITARLRITEKSKTLAKTGHGLIPGAFAAAFDPWYLDSQVSIARIAVPVIARAQGALVSDVDGNEYIDFIGGHGALILGHADNRVIAAITKAAAKGYAHYGPTELSLRLAELILERFRGAEELRWACTPSDAIRTAIDAAQLFTERGRIVTTEDYRFASATGDTSSDVVVTRIPYNDLERLRAQLTGRKSDVGAVLIEPIRHGQLALPAPGFLAGLRAQCDESGALLIFDESVSGLRLDAAQRESLFGVSPDMTILGPGIGGGLPLAACLGSRKCMTFVNEATPNDRLAATHSMAMAAGTATLEALTDPESVDALTAAADRFEAGLNTLTAAHDIPICHTRVTNMFHIGPFAFQSEDQSRLHSTVNNRYAAFHRALLDQGVLFPPSPNATVFVSSAHTIGTIDRAVNAIRNAMNDMRA